MQRRLGNKKQFYEEWMENEGIPIYESDFTVEDVTELPRRPWARTGGSGTFIQLWGTKQSGKLLYVAEIPPGGALEPERHLYNELIYIWRGRGLSEVWHEGQSKVTFEWGEGSLFAMPTNTWHRLVNGGPEPVLFFASTNAPAVMNFFRNTEFIFNCDYNFTDRYTGQADYFQAGEKRYKEGVAKYGFWETNFVPDLRTAFLDDQFAKVEGGQLTGVRMASWAGVHSSEWPSGKYHKCHYHPPLGGGYVIMGMKSEGYGLFWLKEYGPHPFQDGHGDKVIKRRWKVGSIYTNSGGGPGLWFHQHFNTGPGPARHMADKGGGPGQWFHTETVPAQLALGFASIRDGGRIIEYEDEDPEIRRMFQEELREKGIKCTMKPVVYRTDPFEVSF